MSEQQNIEAQKKWGEAVNSGKLDVLRELVAPNCVDHDAAPDQVQGAEGFIHYFSQLREAFPDLKVDGECLVADENSVALA